MCAMRKSRTMAATEPESSASASCAPGAITGSNPARRSTCRSALQIAGSSSTTRMRGLPGATGVLYTAAPCRRERREGSEGLELGARRESRREPLDELVRSHPVAGAAGGGSDAPFHRAAHGIGVGEPHVARHGVERIGLLPEEGICPEQARAGNELTRRHEAGARQVTV